jgi:lipoprotein signal peptidase
MAGKSYRSLLWGLALVGTAVDQVTKYGVFRWLCGADHYDPGRGLGEYQVLPGAFELLAQFTGDKETATGVLPTLRTISTDALPRVNHGALFGLGGEYQYLANGVFAVVSVIAALAIAVWSARRATARDRWLCVALGLILAGTLGNLFDRVVFHGVRDFLNFYLINWPVFNFADCCLVMGAGLLLTQAFVGHPHQVHALQPATVAAAVADADELRRPA